MAEPIDVGGEAVAVSASVGVTLADGRDGTAEEVLRRADTALYSAKDHGRSRFEVYAATSTAT